MYFYRLYDLLPRPYPGYFSPYLSSYYADGFFVYRSCSSYTDLFNRIIMSTRQPEMTSSPPHQARNHQPAGRQPPAPPVRKASTVLTSSAVAKTTGACRGGGSGGSTGVPRSHAWGNAYELSQDLRDKQREALARRSVSC